MPTSAPHDRPPTAFTLVGAPASATASAGTSDAGPQSASTGRASSAHGAVEAALKAAESFTSGRVGAVNLQFSVGNADLSLRVEMRSGAVHATFRTDSADLRGNLANEWQSLNASHLGVKLAEPVFTSTGTADAAASGEQSSQQRAAEDRSLPAPTSGRAASASAMDSAAASPAEPVAESRARIPTSVHLQAFA